MEKVIKKQNKKDRHFSCKECCRQMGDYIDGKLSAEDDVLFVEHIRGCKDCKEEFHNYYNFMTNLYFLNYGYNDKYPVSEEELLKGTEEAVYKYKKSRRTFMVALIFLIIVIIATLIFIAIRHYGGAF